MRAVIRHVSSVLVHVPGLVRLGSKPVRELAHRPELLPRLQRALRGFSAAAAYPPHQAFIGAMRPQQLWDMPTPWHHTREGGERFAPFGEIMPELEFLGLLYLADSFDLITLEQGIAAAALDKLREHPVLGAWLATAHRRGGTADMTTIAQRVADGALPLHAPDGSLVGCMAGDHAEDECLFPGVLLENLASKASGFLAVKTLLSQSGLAPGAVEYMIGCGEEAIGDRYQRGGGNLAKSVAEMAGCLEATGSDTKSFCCAPVHSLVIAASLVAAGVYENVIVLGGGSLPKLGMKFLGHLDKGLPILEDVLAGIAVWVGRDDGRSPVIRLDSVGRVPVRAGSQQQDVMSNLVLVPLQRLGLGLADIDRYATELHNPEITLPSGSGDVPRVNYRTIAATAVQQGLWQRERVAEFERSHGLPGFSPTQGHIASALPYVGHAWRELTQGEMRRVMLLAKGSLFLGRMTHLADGLSVVLERNPRWAEGSTDQVGSRH